MAVGVIGLGSGMHPAAADAEDEDDAVADGADDGAGLDGAVVKVGADEALEPEC